MVAWPNIAPPGRTAPSEHYNRLHLAVLGLRVRPIGLVFRVLVKVIMGRSHIRRAVLQRCASKNTKTFYQRSAATRSVCVNSPLRLRMRLLALGLGTCTCSRLRFPGGVREGSKCRTLAGLHACEKGSIWKYVGVTSRYYVTWLYGYWAGGGDSDISRV